MNKKRGQKRTIIMSFMDISAINHTPYRLIGLGLLLMLPYFAKASEKGKVPPVMSSETEECIGCHESLTPGIVADWRKSFHASVTPANAMKKGEMERKVSATEVPESLAGVVVGCYECHTLRQEQHQDNFEHFGYNINVVVSPADCSTCHPTEEQEYARSKKAHAVGNLEKNPLYHQLVSTVSSVYQTEEAALVKNELTETGKNTTCFACHGTVVEVAGMKTVDTDLGEVEVPDLTNWPNQGVGRINPDGTMGSCTACHPRHSFSISIARKPYTCSQCHLAPDVPAWEVYAESKHGNIMRSTGDEFNWDSVPWVPGRDFTAPSCAACHNSLLATADGEMIARRSHDFGSRLWVRIFGLPYSHPQPKDGATDKIVNKDGFPLPVSFDGTYASEYLIDENTQMERKSGFIKICTSCHSTSWANGFFARFEAGNREADQMVLAATRLMQYAWSKGLADPANPFDEVIEKKWVRQWLFYGSSYRYAGAMAGPDYASFKNGRWSMTENLKSMQEQVNKSQGKRKKK